LITETGIVGLVSQSKMRYSDHDRSSND